jgi:hypothetical protein
VTDTDDAYLARQARARKQIWRDPLNSVVKTNPGYAPNPSHAGTGTVVAQIC